MYSRGIILWIVDAQADFMFPDGKLYVSGAEQIIPNLKHLVEAATENGVLLVSSGDAHGPNDPEFKHFSPHCIKGTPGARIIPEGVVGKHLIVPNDPAFRLPDDLQDYRQIIFEKQTLDVFANNHADELVKQLGSTAQYYVCGVVTEFCVRYAAQGLLERGCLVSIVKDAVQTLRAEDGCRALDEMLSLGARLITTREALAAIGADNLHSAGYKTARR
jgi:nicotinamidase/pyrazinamidase